MMPMVSNGLSGSSERWAATQNSMAPLPAGTIPTVFSGGAYMVLQEVTDSSGSTVLDTFKPITFPVSTTFVSSTEEGSGSTGGTAPMRLTGELNASGNVVYGLNLFPAQVPMAPGYYKLTFGFTPTFTDGAANNATLNSLATLNGVNPSDSSASTEGGDVGAQAVIGRASYDSAAQTSSVVIQITSSQTGRRGGGGGTGGTGGGSGHRGGGGQ